VLFVRDISRLRDAKIRTPTPPLQGLKQFEPIFFRFASMLLLS